MHNIELTSADSALRIADWEGDPEEWQFYRC